MGCSNSNKPKNENIKIKRRYKKKISTTESNNLIDLKFESDNSHIIHFICCRENDIFKSVIEKVFEEKPEFKEYGNIFLCNGYQINENKSLKENQIKDKNIIIVKRKFNDEIEMRKLESMAKEIKSLSNLDVIISAKNTQNLVIFDLFSKDVTIKYTIISNEDSIFNEIINKLYELNPKYNYKNNHFVNYTNNSLVNEYKTLKENNIKLGNLVILIQKKNSIDNIFGLRQYERDERKKLNLMAYKLKEESKKEVIILAKNTYNLIPLKFQSFSLNINCYVLSDKNEIFNKVANKVFEEMKKYKEYGIIFLCNGNQVNEYKSLKENKFKDYDIIKIEKGERYSRDNNKDNNNYSYYKIINEEKKIKNLAEKIKQETNIDVIILAKDTKNLMKIKLESYNRQINYYVLCKEDDICNSILNQVFKLQPEFINYEFSIICSGYAINRYKTLKQNHIKSGNTIYMNKERKIMIKSRSDTYSNEKILNGIANRLNELTNIDVVIATKKIINLLKIKFQLAEQDINCCYAICNGDDIFYNVVNKIFEKKPEFKEHNNYFLCNGNKINKYKSLYENNIKEGDEIILCEDID